MCFFSKFGKFFLNLVRESTFWVSFCYFSVDVIMGYDMNFMDIIVSTKSCALHVEHTHKENEAKNLRQNVSVILQKNLNLKIRSNLKNR